MKEKTNETDRKGQEVQERTPRPVAKPAGFFDSIDKRTGVG
jgi:hypothetical protein